MGSSELENELEEELWRIYREAKALGYTSSPFAVMLDEEGGLGAAKKLLTGIGHQDGLTRLWEMKRLDLTVEAIALNPRFAIMFTEKEIKIAKNRLTKLGYETCESKESSDLPLKNDPPDVIAAIQRWLESHDDHINRFAKPIPISDLAEEVECGVEDVRGAFRQVKDPLYHPWRHLHSGRESRSKPYCLRINGPDSVGLDWENSVIGAAEAEFRRSGFTTKCELGSERDIEALIEAPDLARLTAGVNQRDFWALRVDGKRLNLWIVEAKGKEAFEFDHYSFAEALGQVFPLSEKVLSGLLGTKRKAGHGLVWAIASRLHSAWLAQGFEPTVTVSVLFPNWTPDVVWSGGKVRRIEKSCFARPIRAFRDFIVNGTSEATSGRFKYQRCFGQGLEELDKTVGIRRLARAETGLRFRLLTVGSGAMSTCFEMTGAD